MLVLCPTHCMVPLNYAQCRLLARLLARYGSPSRTINWFAVIQNTKTVLKWQFAGICQSKTRFKGRSGLWESHPEMEVHSFYDILGDLVQIESVPFVSKMSHSSFHETK